MWTFDVRCYHISLIRLLTLTFSGSKSNLYVNNVGEIMMSSVTDLNIITSKQEIDIS